MGFIKNGDEQKIILIDPKEIDSEKISEAIEKSKENMNKDGNKNEFSRDHNKLN